MPTTEAQMRATQKYRKANEKQVRTKNREHWVAYYVRNGNKIKEQAKKSYYFRKEVQRLRNINLD